MDKQMVHPGIRECLCVEKLEQNCSCEAIVLL